MAEEAPVDEAGVRALARAAALPLPEDRVAAVTGVLRDWLPAANELSRLMSAPGLRDTAPVTTFAHPPTDPTE